MLRGLSGILAGKLQNSNTPRAAQSGMTLKLALLYSRSPLPTHSKHCVQNFLLVSLPISTAKEQTCLKIMK